MQGRERHGEIPPPSRSKLGSFGRREPAPPPNRHTRTNLAAQMLLPLTEVPYPAEGPTVLTATALPGGGKVVSADRASQCKPGFEWGCTAAEQSGQIWYSTHNMSEYAGASAEMRSPGPPNPDTESEAA